MLVPGAGQGIGAALARHGAAEGAAVPVAGRNPDRAERTAATSAVWRTAAT
ncbi:SDR family NAD(P)-dependent oxidoreductase [Streptomyces sp. RPT161]|uniref:SDR family NAD(P)-dependent oxidoreductase n=1 Tax=Streptomyces sp. RPT161 TaxID=3015993 RepID=UPI002FD4665A